MNPRLFELNTLHNAKLVAPFQQSTNHHVVFGKCYGLSVEHGIRKLNPNIKTTFDLKAPFPNMPRVHQSKYNVSINSFAPINQRVSVYQYSQFPLYGLFTLDEHKRFMLNTIRLQRSDHSFFLSHEMNSFIDEMLKSKKDSVSIIEVLGAVAGHAMQCNTLEEETATGKKTIVEFFDCNSGEYRFESIDDFKNWLPKYISLIYGDLFFMGSVEALSLKRVSEQIPFVEKAKNAFNTLKLLGLVSVFKIYNFASGVGSLIDYLLNKKAKRPNYVNNKIPVSFDDDLVTANLLDKHGLYKTKIGGDVYDCHNGLHMHKPKDNPMTKDDMHEDAVLAKKLTKIDSMRDTPNKGSMGLFLLYKPKAKKEAPSPRVDTPVLKK